MCACVGVLLGPAGRKKVQDQPKHTPHRNKHLGHVALLLLELDGGTFTFAAWYGMLGVYGREHGLSRRVLTGFICISVRENSHHFVSKLGNRCPKRWVICALV